MENSAKNKVESVAKKATANANEGQNPSRPMTPADLVQSKANANSTLKKMKQLVSANKLIEAGAHIGLNPRKWNPKMKHFIYAKRSNNHVIDIVKSLNYLNRAFTFLEELTKSGGRVLIVGTNGELVKDLIQKEARRAKAFHVTQRWLGGTLTNFKNITKSINKLNDNINLIKSGEIQKYTKKEQIAIRKETDKLSKFYGGIRTMRKLPQALIVMDPILDKNAVIEARKLNIPVIALANTNANPDMIDFIIPINNNSFRTMWLVLSVLVDAITSVSNEPTKIVGKTDEEIILPETMRRKRNFSSFQGQESNNQTPVKNEVKEEKAK
ncbi:MAG: 30S ribosomal protein S2 [Ureaplasma sp.]|nr:30S ribosomal protein S2 [Ureaplasma sp.]